MAGKEDFKLKNGRRGGHFQTRRSLVKKDRCSPNLTFIPKTNEPTLTSKRLILCVLNLTETCQIHLRRIIRCNFVVFANPLWIQIYKSLIRLNKLLFIVHTNSLCVFYVMSPFYGREITIT